MFGRNGIIDGHASLRTPQIEMIPEYSSKK